MRIRHLAAVGGMCALIVTASALPAAACAGLVTPGGTVRLERTATLAAYANGVEHYITSFQFSGGGAEFGSIVPLPGMPTKVEKGGEWTLQRLAREVAPPQAAARGDGTVAARPAPAVVVYETRIDALDITVLKGGGRAVGRWAKDNGFRLTPDAPAVLEFYGARSPYFMAARFDAAAARDRGQQEGDGTPIHLTIPTKNPWVPLRILSLGLARTDQINSDVFLLTPRKPALMPIGRPGVTIERREPASKQLLDDLRSDKGMGWIPQSMWLTYLRISTEARNLRYDLATDVSGRGRPSRVMAGLARPRLPKPPSATPAPTRTPSPAPPSVPPTTPAAVATSAPPRVATRPAAARPATPVAVGLAAALAATAGFALALAQRRRGRTDPW